MLKISIKNQYKKKKKIINIKSIENGEGEILLGFLFLI